LVPGIFVLVFDVMPSYNKGVGQTTEVHDVKEIRFKIDKNGRRRAYYFSYRAMRWFPMSADEADILIATEQAYVPENPLLLTR
jgi:hypothetical protein